MNPPKHPGQMTHEPENDRSFVLILRDTCPSSQVCSIELAVDRPDFLRTRLVATVVAERRVDREFFGLLPRQARRTSGDGLRTVRLRGVSWF